MGDGAVESGTDLAEGVPGADATVRAVAGALTGS
jgi:hypothetical protein